MSIISAGTTLTTALVQTGDTNGNLVFRTGASGTTALTLGADQSATFAGAVSFGSSAFGLGSAGAPSITFTGDTNTGIFSPAADTIAFTEGGVESMRIDSSGNLGIGTVSPAFGLTVQKDNGSGYVAGFRSASGSPMLTIQNTGGISQIQGLNSALSATADIALQVSGGNVGIGTSSPEARLQVNTGTNDRVIFRGGSHNTLTGLTSAITFSRPDGATNLAAVMGWNSGGLALAGREGIAFATGGGDNYSNTVERMRIDASGNVGIGTSSPVGKFQIQGPTNQGRFYTNANVTDYTIDSNDDTVRGKSLYFRYCGTGANRALIFTDGTLAFQSGGDGYSAALPGQSTQYPAFFARAWVNFNGTGTVAIRASGNVSSITDNGTGDYTVNFTSAMPDTNYCVSTTSGNGNGRYATLFNSDSNYQGALATGSVRVQFAFQVSSSSSRDDANHFSVTVFR